MLCVLRDRHGHTPVSPMTGASSGLCPAAPCPSDVGCSTPSFALSCSQIQLWQERQWEPWCFLWETIPVHNAAPMGSSLLFLWALRDFQQGKQILLGLAGCSAQPRFLGCILPSWSLHMGQHPHKPSPCKEGTRAASVTRDKQHSELGDSIPGRQRCAAPAAAQPQPWHPQCPHYTQNTGGHWLLCSALPLLAVSWTRLCLHDGTHSSPPHMLLLCLPSHWACSSRFFQIISFLAPAFTK